MHSKKHEFMHMSSSFLWSFLLSCTPYGLYLTKKCSDGAEGQLGYPSVDTQSTPRRVSSLKSRIVAVAAANKHSAAVAETGEVFTWGCNKEGQLGYGTSNSASNCIPRMVEYLKGKVLSSVSAAKYHTIVLGVDGEVSSCLFKHFIKGNISH
jgi:alpha-tubulin suppressor-like RCC1 family protein